jgi:hypothetical protein
MFMLLMLAALSQAPAASDAAALFREGATFQDFLEGAQSQRKLWEQNAARPDPAAPIVERFKRVSDGLSLLVVSEAACSDSVQTVPYIAKLAALANVELRIVSKARAMAVIDAHRTPDGRTATPTVLLLRDGKVIGAWVERPAVLQEWFLANRDLTSRERLERKTAWYEWDRGASTIAEVVALAEKAAMRDGRR